jgi:hypothetical protein
LVLVFLTGAYRGTADAMKIAYLYFIYKNPRLITKTISRLRNPDSSFFVHVDRKFAIAPFEPLKGDDVTLVEPRIDVYWAEFTGCEAILLLIRKALQSDKHFDYLVLLSGTEYPLRSGEYINRFLETNKGQEFITMAEMPAPGKPLSRLNTIRFPSTRPIPRLLFRVLAKAGLAQRDYRKHLGALSPFSGVTWWALTRAACQHLLQFSDANPSLKRFFHNVFAPEETYFHTILGNSPFRDRVRRGLLYEDWTRASGKWSDPKTRPPAVLSRDHVAFFSAQQQVSVSDLHGAGELLLARKLNDADLDLAHEIDDMICRKDRVTSVF